MEQENLSRKEARSLGPPVWTTRKRMVIPSILLVTGLFPGVVAFFYKHGITWLYVPLFAWALSSLITPFVIRISFLTGWLDIPHGRKDHARPTPLLGGAAIIGAFGLTLLITYKYSLPMKGLGISAFLIWFVGVLDDRFEIRAIVKLLIQFIAVGVLIAFGVQVTFMPDTWWGITIEYAITFVWVLGITNAVNFLDGMDGLAAGMSAIVSFFLAVVAMQSQQFYFMVTSLALTGACLGFLPYNLHPKKNASIFLGDNGATFLGFTLAATALMGDWADNNFAAIIIPVLLLGVPIFDMTMTTIIRFGTGQVRTFGQWLAYTGRDHFHHRLAALGIGRFGAVLIIYAVTIIIGIPAIVLKQARGVDAALLLIQGGLFFILLSFFMISVRKRQIRLFIAEQGNGVDKMDENSLSEKLRGADKPAKD